MGIFTFKDYRKTRNIRSPLALKRAKKRWKEYKQYKTSTGWKIMGKGKRKAWILRGM